jgi:hypothetical protein
MRSQDDARQRRRRGPQLRGKLLCLNAQLVRKSNWGIPSSAIAENLLEKKYKTSAAELNYCKFQIVLISTISIIE